MIEDVNKLNRESFVNHLYLFDFGMIIKCKKDFE